MQCWLDTGMNVDARKKENAARNAKRFPFFPTLKWNRILFERTEADFVEVLGNCRKVGIAVKRHFPQPEKRRKDPTAKDTHLSIGKASPK